MRTDEVGDGGMDPFPGTRDCWMEEGRSVAALDGNLNTLEPLARWVGSYAGWERTGAAIGLGLTALLAWAVVVSRREGEARAGRRFLTAAIFLFLFSLGTLALPSLWGALVGAMITGGTVVLAFVFLLPGSAPPGEDLGRPVPGVDERDIMFSRAELSPGSFRFRDYYSVHPGKLELDDAFRREPGLLAPGSSQFHREGFAAADAAFWTIERLRPFVEGEEGGTEGPPPSRQEVDPTLTTGFLKAWCLKLGAHSVGVTELRDYHLYSHVGRGLAYGEPVRLDHSRALALTVEMDGEMVGAAPRSPTVMESAHQYLRSGVMAIQLADLIRRLGYRARAHVDGSYRVICPLVARDAGLGEIGRMGLLMTPRLGPRVRIAVVTTDLPLTPDHPRRDFTVLDFCARCRKCARACPSGAISMGDPSPDARGVRRWRIDSEACFTLWTRLGTDCARCMAVCPYSHPDHLLHNAVRWGVRRNAAFRQGAVWMDDLLYGARPKGKELPAWFHPEKSH